MFQQRMVSLAGESDVEELECTAFTQSSKIARYGCRMRPEKWDMRSLDLQLHQAALLESYICITYCDKTSNCIESINYLTTSQFTSLKKYSNKYENTILRCPKRLFSIFKLIFFVIVLELI